MSGTRGRPAGDRPGRYAWPGPISLCLAVLSLMLMSMEFSGPP